MLDTLKNWFSSDTTEAEPSENLVQQAAAFLLFEVALIDRHIAEGERQQLLSSVLAATALSQTEAEVLLKQVEDEAEALTSHHRFVRTLVDELDERERALVVEHMWRVAHADGELDRYEEQFIRRVADLLYLPHSLYIQAKLKAEEAAA